MVILIAGGSHTGKTLLAQRLLERHHYPYLSIDHLKMGLIRSGQTRLTPEDDRELTDYLWPIVREMVKTAIENRQNLIVEGCYIPFDWAEDFPPEYRAQIRCRCLVMSERYIREHFGEILSHANDIEQRLDDGIEQQQMQQQMQQHLLRENAENLEQCRRHGCDYLLIDAEYPQEIILNV